MSAVRIGQEQCVTNLQQISELLAEYDWSPCAIERERIADELAALGYTVVRHGKCEPVTPIVIDEAELPF